MLPNSPISAQSTTAKDEQVNDGTEKKRRQLIIAGAATDTDNSIIKSMMKSTTDSARTSSSIALVNGEKIGISNNIRFVKKKTAKRRKLFGATTTCTNIVSRRPVKPIAIISSASTKNNDNNKASLSSSLQLQLVNGGTKNSSQTQNNHNDNSPKSIFTHNLLTLSSSLSSSCNEKKETLQRRKRKSGGVGADDDDDTVEATNIKNSTTGSVTNNTNTASQSSKKYQNKASVSSTNIAETKTASQVESSYSLCSSTDSDTDDADDRKIISDNNEKNNYIGCKIAKQFDGTIYFGSVHKFIKNSNSSSDDDEDNVDGYGLGSTWYIYYTDGDTEELEKDELMSCIALYQKIKEQERMDTFWDAKVKEIKYNFLAERDAIYSRLPHEMISSFNQIGFGKWSVNFRPVLFLGPYDVSPGPVRDEWMVDYKKNFKSPHKMRRLVHWYGSGRYENSFSLILLKNCLSYEKGVKRGYVVIPATIKRKHEEKTPLTNQDQTVLLGLKQMKEDLGLKKKKCILPFHEDYQKIKKGLMLLTEFQNDQKGA